MGGGGREEEEVEKGENGGGGGERGEKEGGRGGREEEEEGQAADLWAPPAARSHLVRWSRRSGPRGQFADGKKNPSIHQSFLFRWLSLPSLPLRRARGFSGESGRASRTASLSFSSPPLPSPPSPTFLSRLLSPPSFLSRPFAILSSPLPLSLSFLLSWKRKLDPVHVHNEEM